ncbi:MAG: glycosyltransferase family 4 protein [Oligoflexales bacterium]
MENILFVIDRNFLSNSAVHVHSFANHLALSGFQCIVAVPDGKDSATKLGDVYYQPIEYKQIENLPVLYPNGGGPDIIHCWTPREIVRKLCDKLFSLYEFKLLIHLEDNEELLTQRFAQTESLSDTWSHPVRYRDFLNKADGITVIIEELKAFVPSDKPTLTLWPGVNFKEFFPRPPSPDLISKLQLPLNSVVIVYTGNVHAANATEVRSLYLAVAMLNREGTPTFLVRTGENYLDFLGDYGRWVKPYCAELGFVDRSQIPEILALADILIQPGKADEFNKYRFPSKLPEFMAMGKPLILPAVNIGCLLKNGEQAIVLEKADAINIVEAVKKAIVSQELMHQISDGALKFAREHFSWEKQSNKLKNFYWEIMSK